MGLAFMHVHSMRIASGEEALVARALTTDGKVGFGFSFRLVHQRVGVGAQNAKREGIFENSRAVQHLMRGAKAGGAQRRAAWLTRLHGLVLGTRMRVVHGVA